MPNAVTANPNTNPNPLSDAEQRAAAALLSPGPDNAENVGDWLILALANLLCQIERFSGKDPCGSSGWDYLIDEALKKHNVGHDDLLAYLADHGLPTPTPTPTV